MTAPRRRGLSVALATLAALAAVLALVAGYVRHAAIDADQFSNRATAALRDESVRTLVADRITDQVILRRQADLIAARPIISSAVSGVVGGGAFTGLFGAAVRDAHRALLDGDQHTLTLTVADVGAVLGAALQQVRPALARQVDAAGRVELLSRDIGGAGATLSRAADRVKVLALLLTLVAVGLAALAIAVAPDRRRGAVTLGAAVAIGGVLLVVALDVTRALATGAVQGAEERAAAGAVWDAFLADLRVAAWILAGSGAVVAAAAASLLRPVALGEPLRRAARVLVVEPRRPALRALRGAGIVAAGVLMLAARDAVLAFVLTAIGIYLVYEGATVLLRLVQGPPRAEAAAAAPRGDRLRRVGAMLAAGAVVAVAVSVYVAGGGATTPAPAAAGACNGHVELCGRSLPEVALVATHNSMSAPLPGWYSSMQEAGIPAQLRAGVRGLLIDTHYGDLLPNGRVRTDFTIEGNKKRGAAEDAVSAEARAAALRIRDRLGFEGQGKRDIWLCHSFCELGATRLSEVLGQLRDFLVANPDEVVVVVNQDEVTPEDFVAAVERAGLAELAYRGPFTGRWPTLRQMIDRGQRVVFLAEHRGGAAPWYPAAYDAVLEETPYAFSKAAQLIDPARLPASCRPNRGPSGAPLLLLNHWVTTDPLPLPSIAAEVNARTPLLRRARTCARIRDHVPNLVAVNFFRRGDVRGVVDALNGVGG